MKAIIKGQDIYIGDSEDIIHYNHSIPTTKWEIEEDGWQPFAVFESCTNYPLVHGVMAESEDDALQQVFETLEEDDGELLGVQALEF